MKQTNFTLKTTESSYEKDYNNYCKLFSIDDEYKLKEHSKNYKGNRYLLLLKAIGGRVICFAITSQSKPYHLTSYFEGIGKDGIDV